MVIKVGINGFGRIGRVIFRTCLQNSELLVSAINDPAIDIEYICYLIKFDSTHGKFNGNVTHSTKEIHIDGKTIAIYHEKHPTSIPWQAVGVQYVVEASGMFTSLDKASGHLASDSVKRVIVTAPSVDVPMIILGVNNHKLTSDIKVLSCASSTLYCLAPIIKVLEDNFGVAEGFITSIHAMTPSLKPLDGLCIRGKHWRDHRSIHQNIIPASTGACKALGKIIPHVKDKMSGLAFRIPIVNVSVLDMTIRLNTNTTLHDILKSVEKSARSTLKNIINVSNEETVSSDFIGDHHSCTFDLNSSLQLRPNFYKLICWYENEYSYACRVIDSIFYSEKQLLLTLKPILKITYIQPEGLDKNEPECSRKEMLIECKYNSVVNSKIKNISPEIGFKEKSQPRLKRKPLSSGSTSTASNREPQKRNDIFKIWDDDHTLTKVNVPQNRNSFFQSCITFTPKDTEKKDYTKTRERLENVKKEFSKMVNITEDLLKKSNSNKLQFNPTKLLLDNLESNETNQTSKSRESSKQTIKIIDKYKITKKENSLFDVSGDYKSSINTINSKMDDCKECAISYDSLEKNNSDYNINELKIHKKTEYQDLGNLKDERVIELKEITSISNLTASSELQTTVNEELHEPKLTTNKDFTEQVTKTINNLITGLSESFQCGDIVTKSNITDSIDTQTEELTARTKTKQQSKQVRLIKIKDNIHIEKLNNSQVLGKNSGNKRKDEIFDHCDNISHNTDFIDERLKKHNIVLLNERKDNIDSEAKDNKTVSIDDLTVETHNSYKEMDLRKQILQGLNKFTPEPVVIVSEDTTRCASPENTNTTISNGDNANRHKTDIYDKLDSVSVTDSENSFQIDKRKSQIINITDLTNSLEDLSRLDKICRIIEISDELSDQLFSVLENKDGKSNRTEWSFKDLCERIKLDEFCNKVFGKSTL